MKHKFRFTKDTMKRLTDFIRRKEEQPAAEEASVPEKPGVQVCALTDVGKVRAVNQDALWMRSYSFTAWRTAWAAITVAKRPPRALGTG